MNETLINAVLVFGSCGGFAWLLMWNEERAEKAAAKREAAQKAHAERILDEVNHFQFTDWKPREGERPVNRGAW